MPEPSRHLHRMALQASELTNYIFKQHGKY